MVRTIKRETRQIFDLILQQLFQLSAPSVVQFINALFGKNHPIDSTVEYPKTESVSKKLRRLMSDMMVIIGGRHAYHVEGQIKADADIVVRVFEYGFAEGLRTKTSSDDGNKISMKFPEARIIYWESTKDTPDETVLSIEFPGGAKHDFAVKTVKFLSYNIGELERMRLILPLPFYVLKLRRRVTAAKTPESRAKLAAEMKEIVDELTGAIERAVTAGLLSENDGRVVTEYTERLYRELYQEYDEFREVDDMLKGRILTYSEEVRMEARIEGIGIGEVRGEERKAFEVASKMLKRGMDLTDISDIAGLPIEKIQNLIPQTYK